MRITVIGTGYVGLVVGTGLAENGHFVTCLDKDAEKIAALNAGNLPIYEPGLEELVARNIEEERLHFSTEFDEPLGKSLMVFLCVGTPSRDDGSADTTDVLAAAETVARAMTGYQIIVVKSTCPVGTADAIRDLVASMTEHPFDVVVNPEFLKEGAAVDDFMRPDRVVIGCNDVRVLEIMKELYAPFTRTGKPVLPMSIRSAEMAKYANNVMLAARISLMNELAGICSAWGADIAEVREGLMADSRIGSTYLFPGLGFGGSCLPKDVAACANSARQKGVACDMLTAIATVNERQVANFAKTILAYYGGDVRGKKMAVWGASFKPRTDDIRCAPCLHIVDTLLAAGAAVAVYDPVAGGKLREHYGDRITVAPKSYSVLEGADGLVIATEWREFHYPDFDRMAATMREKVIFDGRNLYSPKVLAKQGFHYHSIGRPSV